MCNNYYGAGSTGGDEYTFAELGINHNSFATPQTDHQSAPTVNTYNTNKPAIVKYNDVDTKRIYGDVYEYSPRIVSAIPDTSRIICHIPDRNGKHIRMTETMLSKHLLAVGGIGCGKTNVIYHIVNDIKKTMTDNDIMFVFDSKGDFYNKFGRLDPKALVVGSNEFYDILAAWNIFSELLDKNGEILDDFNLRVRVYEITGYFEDKLKSDSQPFFFLSAQDILSMVIMSFCREARKTGDYSKLNNRELVNFINNAEVKDYHELFFRPGNEDFRSAKNYYGDPFKDLTPQALGVFGSVKMMVRSMFIGPFAGAHEKSFGMSSLVRRKGGLTVYIEYDLSIGEVLGPMYGLLIDLALKQALGGRDANRGNVYFVIDEMRLIGAPKHISDALNFGRSQNVKIIAGIQNINQLYDAYGMEKGKSIASGFMNSFCFQSFDSDTRKYIAERSGETYDNLSFTVTDTTYNIQRAGHVVEDWDILALDVGEAFVNLFGHVPFRFSFEKFE